MSARLCVCVRVCVPHGVCLQTCQGPLVCKRQHYFLLCQESTLDPLYPRVVLTLEIGVEPTNVLAGSSPKRSCPKCNGTSRATVGDGSSVDGRQASVYLGTPLYSRFTNNVSPLPKLRVSISVFVRTEKVWCERVGLCGKTGIRDTYKTLVSRPSSETPGGWTKG